MAGFLTERPKGTSCVQLIAGRMYNGIRAGLIMSRLLMFPGRLITSCASNPANGIRITAMQLEKALKFPKSVEAAPGQEVPESVQGRIGLKPWRGRDGRGCESTWVCRGRS